MEVLLSADKESLETEDNAIEVSLRPKVFEEFPGQDKVKEKLKVFVQATKKEMNHWIMFCYVDLRV